MTYFRKETYVADDLSKCANMGSGGRKPKGDRSSDPSDHEAVSNSHGKNYKFHELSGIKHKFAEFLQALKLHTHGTVRGTPQREITGCTSHGTLLLVNLFVAVPFARSQRPLSVCANSLPDS